MAKLVAGAAALVDNDGCAVGCAGVPCLRCVCFTPTKANALISRTARTTPVAMWGSCGRYRLDDRTPPLPLTFTTFTGYGAQSHMGPELPAVSRHGKFGPNLVKATNYLWKACTLLGPMRSHR